MKRKGMFRAVLVSAILVALGLVSTPSPASKRRQAPKLKIFAQRLVEQTLAKHPEVSGIELSIRSSTGCSTIAASDRKDIGERCDQDELEPIRTGKPWVEEESDGFDITLSLHDTTGQLIGAVGMDFKPKAGQRRSSVLDSAEKIRQELEAQIPSQAKLLEPVD